MNGVQKAIVAVVVAVPLGAAAVTIAMNPHPLYQSNPGGIATPPNPAMAYPDLSRSGGELSREIHFVRGAKDSLYVVDVATGATLQSYAAMEGGFVRGVLRPLDHERKRHDVDLDAPYRVVRESGGRLTLRDEASNVEIDVAAFGPTSYELFSSLLEGRDAPDVPALFVTPTSMEDRP